MKNASGQKMNYLLITILLCCPALFFFSACSQTLEEGGSDAGTFSALPPPDALTGEVPPPKPNGSDEPPDQLNRKAPANRRFAPGAIMVPPLQPFASTEQAALLDKHGLLLAETLLTTRLPNNIPQTPFSANNSSTRTFTVSSPYSYTEKKIAPGSRGAAEATLGISGNTITF